MPSHIRRPSRRTFRTSSSGYVRRGASAEAATFCGAAPTDRDAGARDYRAFERAGETVCPNCIETISKETHA